ncbi:serine/threonine protein kinase [Fonticula alba]|uniref:Serine/threonine protein kinase n=1 Tax=Fonticula alba TaxID=691883 RepID=A0A058Z9R8_FONAL|nr:serine/threonine protein kinase [Fonticula alba]KCV71034.1 serine/threonine protein kinase [Fonticula alba]|eukprot:XP_009494157.1 serine/threonine protein kinase [Fonticula alba]
MSKGDSPPGRGRALRPLLLAGLLALACLVHTARAAGSLTGLTPTTLQLPILNVSEVSTLTPTTPKYNPAEIIVAAIQNTINTSSETFPVQTRILFGELDTQSLNTNYCPTEINYYHPILQFATAEAITDADHMVMAHGNVCFFSPTTTINLPTLTYNTRPSSTEATCLSPTSLYELHRLNVGASSQVDAYYPGQGFLPVLTQRTNLSKPVSFFFELLGRSTIPSLAVDSYHRYGAPKPLFFATGVHCPANSSCQFPGSSAAQCVCANDYRPSADLKLCERISCPAKEAFNASWPLTLGNAQATGTCNEGWTGLPTLKCSADGVWATSPSGTPCTRRVCPAIYENFTQFPATDSLEVANGVCDAAAGYGGTIPRQCRADGTWGPIAPEDSCGQVACFAETSPTTGIRHPQTLFGQVATATCPAGFAPGLDQVRIQCSSSTRKFELPYLNGAGTAYPSNSSPCKLSPTPSSHSLSSLTASHRNSNSITLRWGLTVDRVGDNVAVMTGASTSSLFTTITGGESIISDNFRIVGLSPVRSYNFRVSMVDDPDDFVQMQFTTTVAPPGPISPPDFPTATRAQITWAPVSFANGYRVSLASRGTYAEPASGAALFADDEYVLVKDTTDTTIILDNLIAGDSYSVRVQAGAGSDWEPDGSVVNFVQNSNVVMPTDPPTGSSSSGSGPVGSLPGDGSSSSPTDPSGPGSSPGGSDSGSPSNSGIGSHDPGSSSIGSSGSDPNPTKGRSLLPIVLPIVLVLLLLVVALVIIWFFWYRRRRGGKNKADDVDAGTGGMPLSPMHGASIRSGGSGSVGGSIGGGSAGGGSFNHRSMAGRVRTADATVVNTLMDLSVPGFLALDLTQQIRQDEVIGTGGLGTVYCGTVLDRAIQDRYHVERVAIKYVHPDEKISEQENTQRFQQEVSILWALSFNDYVIQLIGFSASPPAIITPLYDTDLYHLLHGHDGEAAIIQRGTTLPLLPINQVAWLVYRVARGLASIHAVGVAHRDIKSANVLLNPSREHAGFYDPVICDFGLATTSEEGVNRMKAVAGLSPRYASPETFSHNLLSTNITTSIFEDQQADIYSFGVLLHEIFTRSIPWLGFTNDEIQFEVRSGKRLPAVDVLDYKSHPAALVIKQQMDAALLARAASRPTIQDIIVAFASFSEV